VLAIALAVVITVLVVRPADRGSGNGDPTQQNVDSEFASANDTGPVNIITEDPTCPAWLKIARDYAMKAEQVGWATRDFAIPATVWTPEQERTYETVGRAMTDAADRAFSLAKQTPHRVMRELYGQYAAYSRLFATKIATYVSTDDDVAVESDTIGNALSHICAALSNGSAPATAPLLAVPKPPSDASPPQNEITADSIMLASSNAICVEWISAADRFSEDTAAWRAIDPNVPAADWTPEQRDINNRVVASMNANADTIEQLARTATNPSVEDIATLAAQYRRAYATAIPNYAPPDNLLAQAASSLVRAVTWACKAAD
jgi:hypothetical protein